MTRMTNMGLDGGPRPGWVRNVEVPESLDELRGPTQGEVGLPLELYWSGPNPQAVRWNVGEPDARRDLYEIVLREGTLNDARAYINGAELVEVWDHMFLPRWIRVAWQPVVDTARAI